jgi:hypothetical protein
MIHVSSTALQNHDLPKESDNRAPSSSMIVSDQLLDRIGSRTDPIINGITRQRKRCLVNLVVCVMLARIMSPEGAKITPKDGMML